MLQATLKNNAIQTQHKWYHSQSRLQANDKNTLACSLDECPARKFLFGPKKKSLTQAHTHEQKTPKTRCVSNLVTVAGEFGSLWLEICVKHGKNRRTYTHTGTWYAIGQSAVYTHIHTMRLYTHTFARVDETKE